MVKKKLYVAYANNMHVVPTQLNSNQTSFTNPRVYICCCFRPPLLQLNVLLTPAHLYFPARIFLATTPPAMYAGTPVWG